MNLHKFNPARSVGMKLFLAFFVSIVLFVLLVGIISFEVAKQTITDKAEASSQETIIQTNLRLDLIFAKYAQVSNQLIADKIFMDNVQKYQETADSYEQLTLSRDISDQFNKYLLVDSAIDSIQLIYLDGSKAVIGQGSIKEGVEKEPWFKEVVEAKGKLVWIPSLDSASGSKTKAFAVARVIKDVNSLQNIGIIVLKVKLDSISEELAAVKLSDN
ncbi:MAG TPA: cache domain-containing protein, partial [Bacilli bacterium]